MVCVNGQKRWVDSVPTRVLSELVEYAKASNLEKIILFGSRARGNHTERSDIDLAVSGGNFEKFYWYIKEEMHTLLMFDIINLDVGISDELEKEIQRDGVLIYEKD